MMFDIDELKQMKLLELQEIAQKIEVPKFRQLKKLDLVYQILDVQASNPKEVKEKAGSVQKTKRKRISQPEKGTDPSSVSTDAAETPTNNQKVKSGPQETREPKAGQRGGKTQDKPEQKPQNPQQNRNQNRPEHSQRRSEQSQKKSEQANSRGEQKGQQQPKNQQGQKDQQGHKDQKGQ